VGRKAEEEEEVVVVVVVAGQEDEEEKEEEQEQDRQTDRQTGGVDTFALNEKTPPTSLTASSFILTPTGPGIGLSTVTGRRAKINTRSSCL
jgi:hypothetical protein